MASVATKSTQGLNGKGKGDQEVLEGDVSCKGETDEGEAIQEEWIKIIGVIGTTSSGNEDELRGDATGRKT